MAPPLSVEPRWLQESRNIAGQKAALTGKAGWRVYDARTTRATLFPSSRELLASVVAGVCCRVVCWRGMTTTEMAVEFWRFAGVGLCSVGVCCSGCVCACVKCWCWWQYNFFFGLVFFMGTMSWLLSGSLCCWSTVKKSKF